MFLSLDMSYVLFFVSLGDDNNIFRAEFSLAQHRTMRKLCAHLSTPTSPIRINCNLIQRPLFLHLLESLAILARVVLQMAGDHNLPKIQTFKERFSKPSLRV